MKLQDRGKVSREKILRVSLELFANNGFSKTSVREICKLSNVNLSSIKYYFGDKENLYKEVYGSFVGPSGKDRVVYKKFNNLEEQIEQMFSIMFDSLKDETFKLGMKLHMREQLDPTGLWKNDIQYDIYPKHLNTFNLIKKEIPNISNESANRLIFSIVSLFLGILVNQDVINFIDHSLLEENNLNIWKKNLIKYSILMIDIEKQKWRNE